MTIINGGDLGSTFEGKQQDENLRKNFNFDLIMIGGDITYDNNMYTCYNTWDLMLEQVPHKFPTGNITRLIPLILATGNHDVGVNSNNNHTWVLDDNQPVFFHWFP